nr:potassium channel KAT3-like [Ipomoea batatas]
MAGELGVIFNIPQPFTVRSKRLSQVIRISHHHFEQLLQPLSDDGKKILSNFCQHLRGLRNEELEEIPMVRELLGDPNNNEIIAEPEGPESKEGQKQQENKKRFGKRGTKVLMANGSEVEDIGALRENDHLYIC